MDVDVEIDLAHAGLFAAVRAALMPASIAYPRVPDIGQPQASPLRQSSAAAAGELPCQHHFLTAAVEADDVRTEFAGAAVVGTHHLLFAEDGVAE